MFSLALYASNFLCAQTYQYSAFPKQIGVWHFTEYNDYWNIVGGQNHQYVLDTSSGLMVGSGAYFEENKRIYLVGANDTSLMYDFNFSYLPSSVD